MLAEQADGADLCRLTRRQPTAPTAAAHRPTVRLRTPLVKPGVPVLDASVLATMHTRSLLARLRRLHRCEDSASGSDAAPDELAATVGIVFKDTPEWATAYREVKQVLASREHVPHGPERQAARTDRARANQSAEHRRRRHPAR